MNISQSLGHRTVLIGAALIEIVAGVGLMLAPSALVAMLVGIGPEGAALVLGRMAGIALLGLGLAAWPTDRAERPAFHGLLAYNGLVAIDLAWLGAGERLGGPLLWPTVILHTATALLLVVTRRGFARHPHNPRA
jgi:hypothetical protein